MGKPQSKVVNPNANVVNEVEVIQEQANSLTVEICIIIITIILGLDFILRIYYRHSRRLKKRYLSRANELEKI